MGKIDTSILERAERIRKEQESQQIALFEDRSKVVELTAWRYAREVALFPFSAPQKGVSRLEYTSPDGTQHVRASTGELEGLPTVDDEEILDFVVTKAREIAFSTGEIPRKIRFIASECLLWLKKKGHGGKQRERVIGALRRYSDTSFRTNRFGRDGSIAETGFHLLEYGCEDKNKRDTYIIVTFSDSFLQSLRAGHINALPEALQEEIVRSRSPLRKMLIRRVRARMANKKKQVFLQSTLMKLCLYEGRERQFRYKLEQMQLPWNMTIEKSGQDHKITFQA